MRYIGTKAMGIRLPIINGGDNLSQIVTEYLALACEEHQLELSENDVLGVTEAVVAKAQQNYADLCHVAEDVSAKFPEGEVGVVFPILSRNRFLNILKGISMNMKKVHVLLSMPSDEVGNPIMDIDTLDSDPDSFSGLMSAEEFRRLVNYRHPFTDIDYISLYEQAGPNVSVHLSQNPLDILKLTKNVLVGEIHNRFRTVRRLERAGAARVFCLSDILSAPITVNGVTSGYNGDYGVLGSNMATDSKLKLFPRDCGLFANDLQQRILDRLGVKINVMVYGDGAFKDPACGIWELADPVVSPGYTERLGGKPNEIKLKYVAEHTADLSRDEQSQAIERLIKEKADSPTILSEGTTPRKFADLLGSLCDLMSGSGDKGTPVILIQGYFDDYTSK